MTDTTEGQERVAALQSLRQVVESAVEPQVSWEKQFDHTVREVRLELAHAPHMSRHGWGDAVRFQPQWVKLLFDNGIRRSVAVLGPRVLKSGDLGLSTVESYYSFTKDDEHMPEWLKRLVAEVSS